MCVQHRNKFVSDKIIKKYVKFIYVIELVILVYIVTLQYGRKFRLIRSVVQEFSKISGITLKF